MPVQTRRQVQTPIPFKCRKTRNSSKTPQSKSSKTCTSPSAEHDQNSPADCRPRKSNVCEQVQSRPEQSPATGRLTNESPIKGGNRQSIESRLTKCDAVRRSSLTTPPSPRKRTLLQEVSTNDGRPSSPCCSPRKMKKENIPVDTERDISRLNLASRLTDETADLKANCSPHLPPVRRTPKKLVHRESECLSSPRSKRKEGLEERPVLSTPPRLKPSPKKITTPLTLGKAEGENYQRTKQALHTALPDHLLCRDKELETITSFLKNHLKNPQAGSLYISGAPGTGKTACLSHVIKQQKKVLGKAQVIFVNCMSVRHSQGIYGKILDEMGQPRGKAGAKDAAKKLQKTFTSSGPMIVLVLDEVDHLDSKGQEVLYTMFEWPSLPNSRLVLLGIANALDLTDRILPRLQARPKCKPQLLHFPPYSKDQIAAILVDRVQNGSDGGVVEPLALQLCARKVAAVAGDIRKALDVCRRAVEIIECDVRSQLRFKSPGTKHGSSPDASSQPCLKRVGLKEVSSVIAEVYGSRLTSSGSQSQTFPLQQKLMICTVLLMVRGGRLKEVTLGKCHESYSKLCKSRRVPAVEQSEFLSLCQLVESRGLIGLKYAKDTRQIKISLKLNEKEVEAALQDKVLLSSILQENTLKKK